MMARIFQQWIAALGTSPIDSNILKLCYLWELIHAVAQHAYALCDRRVWQRNTLERAMSPAFFPNFRILSKNAFTGPLPPLQHLRSLEKM